MQWRYLSDVIIITCICWSCYFREFERRIIWQTQDRLGSIYQLPFNVHFVYLLSFLLNNLSIATSKIRLKLINKRSADAVCNNPLFMLVQELSSIFLLIFYFVFEKPFLYLQSFRWKHFVEEIKEGKKKLKWCLV